MRSAHNKYIKKRYHSDKSYKLSVLMSRGILQSLRNSGGKGGKHWERLVDYNANELEAYLKSTFPEGMTWDDFLEGKLHIDHKIPLSVFNFNSPNDIDFGRAWSKKNLQFLKADDNLRKSDKLEAPFQPSLSF